MTTETTVRALTLGTALASVVTGGALFAFSSFVMPALRRLPAGEAVAAMQAINVAAPRSLLMVPLLGSAAGSAVLAVVALTRGRTPERPLLLAGAALGVIAFAITAAYHVPHNDAFAQVRANATDAAQQWRSYAGAWTTWNHVRTAAAIGSAVALVTAVLRTSSRG